jgi:hypothetical protein
MLDVRRWMSPDSQNGAKGWAIEDTPKGPKLKKI